MFSTLRNRFGIPGVISVVALVFAMLGGAYAASNGSDSDKGATASAKKKKALKGPRGPRGPKGATGAAGPAGPAGPAGAKGDTGAAGAAGGKGATGANGVSVTSSVEPKGANCAEGGSKFVASSGTTFACNGKNGKNGEPWTPGGVLPEGETLTGSWNVFVSAGSGAQTPISFPLPLEDEPTATYLEIGDTPTAACPGLDGNGTPQAEPGNLCVYEGVEIVGGVAEAVGFFKPFTNEPTPDIPEQGVGPSGALLAYICEGPVLPCGRLGTWAVTAAE